LRKTLRVASDIATANPVSSCTDHRPRWPRLQQGCVAQLTGGKLYDAQDAAGVAAAFDAIIKLAHLEPPAPVAEKEVESKETASRPAAGAPPGLYLTAGLGPESATLESPVRWRVTKAGPDGELCEARCPNQRKLRRTTGGGRLAAAHQSVDVAPDVRRPSVSITPRFVLARASEGAVATRFHRRRAMAGRDVRFPLVGARLAEVPAASIA
jgi:hypothetical protein